MIAWTVGPRRSFTADETAADVAWRIDGRIQVTTDGLHAYKVALTKAFGKDRRSHYASRVKLYGDEPVAGRYSPGECREVEIIVRWGDPDPDHISTSYVERSNLTVRMGVRRYTRLTNAHSKKFENHVAMTSVFMAYYNFCRVHQTLKATPAMAAGLTDHVWDVREILSLM